jgi:hypothetical protein
MLTPSSIMQRLVTWSVVAFAMGVLLGISGREVIHRRREKAAIDPE